MKTLIVLIVLFSVVCFTNCSQADPENSGPSPESEPEANIESVAENAAIESGETAKTEAKSQDAKASREEIEAPEAAHSGLGPTDTIRALNDAVIKKDAARIRSLLTRASIKMVAESAREQGKTVDQILISEEGAPMPVEREMQNESIDGNNATVEVKNSVLGSFDKMYLVKEDGNWRIALDKFQDEMMRKLNELQKDAPDPGR